MPDEKAEFLRKLQCTGYDVRIFRESESEIIDKEKFLCTFCERVLRSPVQSGCGHRFCSDCFKHCCDTKWVCARCQSESEENEALPMTNKQSFPDNAIKREMNPLRICCTRDGCDWKGSFREFESTHNESCKFNLQTPSCPVCLKSSKIEDIQAASRTADLVHLVECVAMKTRFIQDLVYGTPGSVSPSANRMPITLRLDTVENALNQLHSRSPRKSPYANDADERIAELGNAPVSLPLPGALLPVMQEPRNSENGPGLANVAANADVLERILTLLNNEVERLTHEMDAIQNQQRSEDSAMAAMENKVRNLERKLTLKDVALAEMEKRMTELEEASYDGNLLWRISDFGRKREEATSGKVTSFYSPPFYTSKTGYKMCARIYLNGDGMGKGTHISLFFVLMRGRFDALLKWPFSHKVTLIFIDQNNRDHVTDTFRPDPTSSSFRRPTTEMNIASGCPMFLPLKELSRPQNAYVKDDTAFIRIMVNVESASTGSALSLVK